MLKRFSLSNPNEKLFDIQPIFNDTKFEPIVNRFLPFLERILKIKNLNWIYNQVRETNGIDFIENLYRVTGTTYKYSKSEFSNILESRATIIICNHPLGMLDGLSLLHAVNTFRKDVKVMVDHKYTPPDLKDVFISIDPDGEDRTANIRSLRGVIKWLKAGRIIIIFPSGSISQFQLRKRKVMDYMWNAVIGKLILLTSPTVLPSYCHGQLGFIFQLLGMLNITLRTTVLTRELTNQFGSEVFLRIGQPFDYSKHKQNKNSQSLIDDLKKATYSLASKTYPEDIQRVKFL